MDEVLNKIKLWQFYYLVKLLYFYNILLKLIKFKYSIIELLYLILFLYLNLIYEYFSTPV